MRYLKNIGLSFLLALLPFKLWAYQSIKGEKPHLDVVKLSPRVVTLANTGSKLNFPSFKPYLDNSQVVESFLDKNNLPYIVSPAGEHVTVGKYDKIYARGKNLSLDSQWLVVRLAQQYIDQITKQPLGQLAKALGVARVVREGEPATLYLTEAYEPLQIGDRFFLLPAPDNFSFDIHPPEQSIEGRIIDFLGAGGLSQGGALQNVVINQGMNAKLTPGTRLKIYHVGQTILDVPAPKYQLATLPDEPIGEVLIYRVFDRTSIGLILKVDAPVHLLDHVSGEPLSVSTKNTTEAIEVNQDEIDDECESDTHSDCSEPHKSLPISVKDQYR